MEQMRNGADLKPADYKGTTKRLFGYAWTWKKTLLLLFALSIASIVCELVTPLAIEFCVNCIVGSHGRGVDFESLRSGLFILGILILMTVVLGRLHGVLSAKISVRMSADLRSDVFGKILTARTERMERYRTGDLMSREVNDVKLAAETFLDTLIDFAGSILVIIGSAVIMLIKCPLLAVLIIVISLVSVFLMGVVSKMMYPAFAAQQVTLGKLNAHITESITGIRTAMAYNELDHNRRVMSGLSREYYERQMRSVRLQGIMEPLLLLTGNLSFLVSVVLGAGFLIRGAITVGTMQAFIMYSKQFMDPVNSLGENFVKLQKALAGAERVFEILDEESEDGAVPCRNGQYKKETSETTVEFQHVEFSYRPGLPVLKDFSIKLGKGQKTALVGRTGEGKTTVTNLLLRLYENYRGEIFFQGKDLREISPEELRSRIFLVSQEVHILPGTIADNIRYGCEAASDEEVKKAAADAGLEEWIRSLPKGYDTMIRGQGKQFSQGQMQMLCIARAMLRKPELLILDEATCSIDEETETRIRERLMDRLGDAACLTIAHRLSSVQDADQIWVLENGTIAEQGTFEQLMEQKTVFYTLYTSQYEGRSI